MRRLIGAALLSGAALTAAPAAAAQDDEAARLSFGVTGGTLGVGPEVGYRITERIAVRANATFFSVGRDLSSDDISYDADLRLRSGGVMVDVHPFGGGFRVSGGLRINGNRARGVARPNNGADYSINGTNYSASEIGTLTAETGVKTAAPALTLGYAGGRSRGLVFGIEAGALFQGSVRIKPLQIAGSCASAGAGRCASVQADLEAERASVNADIARYKVYPILQLAVGYRF